MNIKMVLYKDLLLKVDLKLKLSKKNNKFEFDGVLKLCVFNILLLLVLWIRADINI